MRFTANLVREFTFHLCQDQGNRNTHLHFIAIFAKCAKPHMAQEEKTENN